MEELHQLQDIARRFARQNRDHQRTREQQNNCPGYSKTLYKEMATLGWFGVVVPEEYGGYAMGFDAMARIIEELGRSLLAEPIVATCVLAARTLVHGDNERLKTELLPAIVEGTLIPALAWQEANGGVDSEDINCKVTGNSTTKQLCGSKRLVGGAPAADGYIVSALNDNQLELYWVASDSEGLVSTAEYRADGSSSGIISLDGVIVPSENLVASGENAVAAVNRALDEALVMSCAELLGVAREVLESTLEYLRTREQYGKAIGTFQALQHQAVDLYIQQQLCEGVLAEGLAALENEACPTRRGQVASRAKVRCGDATLRITREAIQMHGAIGFTEEFDLGLYVRRAIVLSAWLGNGDSHRKRFAQFRTKGLSQN